MKKLSPFSRLKAHLHDNLNPYLREIVYGGVDGIITTFAVVAVFAGASVAEAEVLQKVPILVVLLFGLANLFADGLSMSVGNFLSTRANKARFRTLRKVIRDRVRKTPAEELDQSTNAFEKLGYSADASKKLVTLLAEHPNTWAEIKLLLEEKSPNPLDESAVGMAMATFVSFIVFGFIPLIPYVIALNSNLVFLYSIITTAIALITLGALRYWVERQSFLQAVLETLMLGSIAALTAFGVGSIFH